MNQVDQIIRALIEADDDIDFDPKEVYPEGSFNELFSLMEKGILDLSGVVERHSNHYVHERTTDCSLREDWNWPDDVPQEVRNSEEERLGVIINQLEKQIDERMVDWNHKIYQELEASYEDSISDEVVAENIRANEYDFTEDGEREDGGGFQYDQLDDDAKQRAREWWVEGEVGAGDNYWAEHVIAEWRWLLYQKGFEGVEINYSGFYSQGDGASFTAKHIDFKRYFSFPDLLEFPETDREQMSESLEDEDFDSKDVGTPVFGKPFGYVLRSQTPGTGYPWFNTRWSDRADCCGNFRRHIGDAKVYKRLSAARSYSSLDVVPIYSDPRKTGENALNPGYVPKPPRPLPPMQEGEDDFDTKDVATPSTAPEVAQDILQRLQGIPQVSDATVFQGTVNPEHTIINGKVNADHWDGGHLVDQAIIPSMDLPSVTITRSVTFAAPQDVYARGFSILVKPMVRESLAERYGGSEKERQLFYHGTSSKLLPKIMAEGLIPEPKVRSWGDDPHKGLIQPTRKSLPGIYVTTNLMTAVSAAGRVARRDKASRLIVVMELQPRGLLADEDDLTGTINALAHHISDHVYSHIWPYFAEVYRDRMRHADEYGPRADQAKAKWVDDAAKQMLYKFGDASPELDARLRELLANEGYRAMLTRMASYAGDWEKGHWVSEWRHLFGTDEDVPPVPSPQEAEEAFLAFKDKLTHTLKGKARPLMQKDWKLNVSGRSMKPIGFTGRDHIVCIVEEIDEKEPTYRTRMLVHYGKPPQQLIKDWTEGHGPLDQPDSIVYKNVSEAFEPHHSAMARTGFWGTQAAGGVFVAQDTGRILIGFRSGDVLQPHTWGSFGGAMDEGEDPAAAAKREMIEETGYNGPMKMVPLYVFEKDTFKYHNFAALVPTEFTPQLNWENDDTRWVKFGEWPEPLHFGLAALIQHSGDKLQLRESDEDFDAKDVVEHPPIPPMEVTSSHGNFKVDADTGMVLELELFDEHDPESQDYKNIARFDMDEWKKTYGKTWPPEDPAGLSVDILDLGAWLTDGSYVPPDEEWRREFRRTHHEQYNRDRIQETDDDFDQKEITLPGDASVYLRYTYDDVSDPEYLPVWDTQGPFCTVDGAVEWARTNMADTRDKITLIELQVIVDGNLVKSYVLDQDFQVRQESPLGGWEPVRESEDEFDLEDFDLKDVAASANIWSVTYHYPDWRKTRYSMGLPRHHPQGSANIVFYSPDTVDSKVVAMKTWQREQLGPNPNRELRRRGQMLLRVFQKLAQKHGDQDVLQFTNAWDWAEAHGEDRDQMMARIDSMVAESEDDFDVKEVADFSPDDLTLTPTFMETAYTTHGDLAPMQKLSDVVNWPELYRAHPKLADMPVKLHGGMPLQISWSLTRPGVQAGVHLEPGQTLFLVGRMAFDDAPARLERRFAWGIRCAIDVLHGRNPDKEAAKEWAAQKTKSRWPADYQYGFDQRPVEEAEEDDFETKELAAAPQVWTYHIFRFPTAAAINYFLVTDPTFKHTPFVTDRTGEELNRGIVPRWPNWEKLSKTVGGHTFPRKMSDKELHQIAQAQIRQFERTGDFDPKQWTNVWEWMRAARESGERKPLPWKVRRRGNIYRHV